MVSQTVGLDFQSTISSEVPWFLDLKNYTVKNSWFIIGHLTVNQKWPSIRLHEYLWQQVLNYSFIVLQVSSLLENCSQCSVRTSRKNRNEKQKHCQIWLKKIPLCLEHAMPNFRLLRDEVIKHLILNRFLQGRNSISSA